MPPRIAATFIDPMLIKLDQNDPNNDRKNNKKAIFKQNNNNNKNSCFSRVVKGSFSKKEAE